MSAHMSKPGLASTELSDVVLLALKNQEARISQLERPAEKSVFKRVTESGSASALFLGLVLSFVTLYDVFFRKPEADRINRLSQFNQAVNSAAKKRQDLVQAQATATDPQLQLAFANIMTPQIMNDIATARAMLRGLADDDVGIPQLIILISEVLNSGDLASGKDFVIRAVNKAGGPPLLHAEAKRYEGKYYFLTGDPIRGRQSFDAALTSIGTAPGGTMPRASTLGDLVIYEFAYGDCGVATNDLQSFASLLQSPQVYPQVRLQLWSTLKAQLFQLQEQHCQTPQNLDLLIAN